jgi:hypothetical protein
MASEHPITPPPELVQQWWHEAALRKYSGVDADKHVTSMAAQWGADQELEACCEWLVSEGWFKYEHEAVQDLRAARRPETPSLKEKALRGLDVMISNGHLDGELAAVLREVLEASPDE